MNSLRDYQIQYINNAREILYKQNKRSVVLQSPTGSGKTAVVSEIISRICQNKKGAWFIVPRKELVKQSSESLAKWQVPHGKIDASNKESRAYKVHIVSLQTLMRRLDKIKELPSMIFIDECHINYDAQKKIFAALPDRGLGTLYDDIAYGASIPYLTQCGYRN